MLVGEALIHYGAAGADTGFSEGGGDGQGGPLRGGGDRSCRRKITI